MVQIKLFFDGSCNVWHNPITAAYGFIIEHEGAIVNQASEHIGAGPEMTNNLAEFEALYQGLLKIQQSSLLDAPKDTLVSVYGDSALVINIMNKRWKASPDKRYYPSYQKCVTVVKELRNSGVIISFNWISREYNKIADKLSKSLKVVDSI
jgi:ribonuclease HI